MVWVRFSTKKKKKVDSLGFDEVSLELGVFSEGFKDPGGRGCFSPHSRGRRRGVIRKPGVRELELGAEAAALRGFLADSQNWPAHYARQPWDLPKPGQVNSKKSTNSPFCFQAPPRPIGSRSRQSAPSPPPSPPAKPWLDRMGARDLVLPIWEPLTRPHARAPPVLARRPPLHRPRPLPHPQGSGSDLPSREVPMSWSSIARIWACADMAAA